MNNREAINVLAEHDPSNFPVYGKYYENKYFEAVGMAIKALEHEPCEDAISRRAVKELFKKKCFGECECCSNYNDADECGLLDELPPVEPKREHGEWKRRLTDNGFNADWHCGKCGWKSALEPCGYNFCPNCGADMRTSNAIEEPTDDCIAIEFPTDINEPSKWQSKDGEWHTGKIPTKTEGEDNK